MLNSISEHKHTVYSIRPETECEWVCPPKFRFCGDVDIFRISCRGQFVVPAFAGVHKQQRQAVRHLRVLQVQEFSYLVVRTLYPREITGDRPVIPPTQQRPAAASSQRHRARPELFWTALAHVSAVQQGSQLAWLSCFPGWNTGSCPRGARCRTLA